MNKQQLLTIAPYLIIGISILFIVYAIFTLQDVENQCNTHLQKSYDQFIAGCSCAKDIDGWEPPANVSIDTPGWIN